MAVRKIVKVGNGRRFEAAAAEAFDPGHLVELNSDGKLQKHAVAGGKTAAHFAVEREWFGEGVSDSYAEDDLVSSEILHSGQEVMALFAAATHTISVGDKLESAGDGTLRALTAGDGNASPVIFPGNAIAVALEAVGTLAAPTHKRVLIL